jgi:hypothetical protein
MRFVKEISENREYNRGLMSLKKDQKFSERTVYSFP